LSVLGFIVFIIGVFLHTKESRNLMKSTKYPSTLDVTAKAPNLSRKEKVFIIFLTINWIFLMPGFGLIFYIFFKMDVILIAIIITVWNAISFSLLIYIERRKRKLL
jgi:hypothetical protein